MASPNAPQEAPSGCWQPARPSLWACLLLAGITVVFFSETLFSPRRMIPSAPGCDVRDQFLAWRKFAGEELRRGSVPLWCPFLYSGMPFMGGYQSGLLYPPNWLYAVLPLVFTITLSVALHIWLSGVFTYFWLRLKGVGFVAALVSGILFMFCTPHYLRLMAGHLPHLCTVPWIALVLLSADGMIGRPRWSWVLLGAFAVAMQLLAGQVQIVFYTAVLAGLYCLVSLPRAASRRGLVVWLAATYLFAGALCAVQIVAGQAAVGESVRGGPVSWQFASSFSLSPENLLTLVAPCFFGDETHLVYWGKWFLWEACVFYGVAGLFLAAIGAFRGRLSGRRALVGLTVLCLVAALGGYTPFYRLVYLCIPLFNRFRAPAKIMLLAAPLIAALAAGGLDALLAAGRARRWDFLGPLLAGLALLSAALLVGAQVGAGPGSPWARFVAARVQSPACQIRDYLSAQPNLADRAGRMASGQLAVSAATCLVVAALLAAGRRRRGPLYVLAGFAALEICLYARWCTDFYDFDAEQAEIIRQAEAFAADHPGDYRVCSLRERNLALAARLRDIWGNDPAAPRRYCEFIAACMGFRPEDAAEQFGVTQVVPIMRMLRLRYALRFDAAARILRYAEIPGIGRPLPRALFIGQYRIVTDRNARLAALLTLGFDPEREVLLEKEPGLRPDWPGEGAAVTVRDVTTNCAQIEARTPVDTLLLLTDSYSRCWRARSLDNPGARYEVLAANHTLMAIPLRAGRHRIELRYEPPWFRAAAWLTGLSWLGFAGAVCLWAVRRRRGRPAP